MAELSVAAHGKLQENEHKNQSIMQALRHCKSNTDLTKWTS